MSKRRCSVCHQYFPKAEMLRSDGVTAVCSSECLQGLAATAREKQRNARSSDSPALRISSTSARKPPNDRSSDTVRQVFRRRKPKGETDRVPPEIAERVFARDGRRCRCCGGLEWLQLHHIRYRSQGVDHSERNLMTLCRSCHDLVHSNKRRWQPLLLETLRLEYEDRKRTTVFALSRYLEGPDSRY